MRCVPESLTPQEAPVRPRAHPHGGDRQTPSLLLDLVLPHVETGAPGAICVTGAAGSGKTEALQDLAARLPQDAAVTLMDEPGWGAVVPRMREELVLYTDASERIRHGDAHLTVLTLADWGEDELIEYLLACHPQRCAGVISRAAGPGPPIPGRPQLWVPILEHLATRDEVDSPAAALRHLVLARLQDPDTARHAATLALDVWTSPAAHGVHDVTQLLVDPALVASLQQLTGADRELLLLLRHPVVLLLLAGEQVCRDLARSTSPPCLEHPLPPSLLHTVGWRLQEGEPGAQHHLEGVLESPAEAAHPMAASLLRAADSPWRPAPEHRPHLSGAHLDGAPWEGVSMPEGHLAGASLRAATLAGADLSGALLDRSDLSGATLRGCALKGAHLEQAILRHADLAEAVATEAIFRGACLQGARLEGARLQRCDLTGCDLRQARLGGADLSGARLKGATLEEADLSDVCLDRAWLPGVDLRTATLRQVSAREAHLDLCLLAGLVIPRADLEGASLAGADLTGSALPRARLCRTDLRGALLAEVSWEHADLREADLRGAIFHAGTSRSGMLQSPLASEGTRTGFYTDEYQEQHFHNPDEIRKANLCGTDLRGVQLDDTDLYLVDLRGARLDPEVDEWARRCGAILGPLR